MRICISTLKSCHYKEMGCTSVVLASSWVWKAIWGVVNLVPMCLVLQTLKGVPVLEIHGQVCVFLLCCALVYVEVAVGIDIFSVSCLISVVFQGGKRTKEGFKNVQNHSILAAQIQINWCYWYVCQGSKADYRGHVLGVIGDANAPLSKVSLTSGTFSC